MTESGMRATTDPAESLIPAMSLDSPSDNAMTALYRVALGPVNTECYLPVFERFDATGRTTTSWNWAACLLTLNWMVFRQLWSAALVYVAAAEGLALLVFGLGRSFLQWPQGVEWGVLGAFALLAFAVPGLYGNALLHADIRKRIARALAASRTVPEACALLSQQASSRKRLNTLVLANVVIGAAAALAYLALPKGGFTPPTWERAVTVADAASAAASAPAMATNSVTASASSTEVPAASTPAASAPPVPSAPPAVSDAPQGAAASAPTPTAAVQPPAPVPPRDAPAPSQTASQPVPKASAPARATAPPQAPAKAPAAVASTSAPRATPTRPAKTPVASSAAAAAESSTASASAPEPVGSKPGYYINVGLFADEANARKAQARLLNEGLPAFRQELNGTNGRRIRVRVGPYDTRAKADAAAASIRAMALDAVVFRQAR